MPSVRCRLWEQGEENVIDPKIARDIYDFINNHYPGGVHVFGAQDGDLMYTSDTIILSKPELDERFKQKVVQEFKGVNILFIVGRQNVTAADAVNLSDKVISYLSKKFYPEQPVPVSISFRACYLLLEATEEIDSRILTGLKEVIDRSAVHRVIYVQPNAMEYWGSASEPVSKKKVAVESVKAHVQKEKSITNDDMTNLKILLGKSQDVNDFLKELENG